MANVNETLQTLYNSNLQSVVQKGAQTVDQAHIENAPISCNVLNQNRSRVIIKDELIEQLAYIKSTIDRQKNTGTIEELPFAMLGHKDKDGNVIITDIIYEATKFEEQLSEARPGSLDTAAAVFEGRLAQQMSSHLQQRNIEHPVVIHGHTHPQNMGVSANITNNFSLADLNGYQSFQENTQRVNPNAEVMGMVINEVGDFNVVEYNSSTNTFERANQVQVGNTVLPSFSEGQYLINNQVQRSVPQTPPARNNKKTKMQEIYQEMVNETNPTHGKLEIIQEPAPKIERVSLEEIRSAGYYGSTPVKPIIERPKEKGFFAQLKDFIGQVFSCDETKFIDQSIRNSRSMINTDFKAKLEALKTQDLLNGRVYE